MLVSVVCLLILVIFFVHLLIDFLSLFAVHDDTIQSTSHKNTYDIACYKTQVVISKYHMPIEEIIILLNDRLP